MAARSRPAGDIKPRTEARTSGRRPAKLSRDAIVNAALTFLDRDGWDALTINALATQLGTKGPSLYNHVDSLDDLRRTVRMRVVGDIIEMLNTVGRGRTRDDAVMAMASALRSAPAAQAVHGAADGPRRASERAVAAAATFVSESGIANGLTRSAPRS